MQYVQLRLSGGSPSPTGRGKLLWTYSEGGTSKGDKQSNVQSHKKKKGHQKGMMSQWENDACTEGGRKSQKKPSGEKMEYVGNVSVGGVPRLGYNSWGDRTIAEFSPMLSGRLDFYLVQVKS